MKKTRKERGWLKKTFKRAMDKELREHKSSFIVFYILRALVIVSLVRQIILDNYEGAFFCILTIVLPTSSLDVTRIFTVLISFAAAKASIFPHWNSKTPERRSRNISRPCLDLLSGIFDFFFIFFFLR